MANALTQGDVYLKVIEDVIAGSKEEFEHAGVGQDTLGELQQVSSVDGSGMSSKEPSSIHSLSASFLHKFLFESFLRLARKTSII